MAEVKISELPQGFTVDDDDMLVAAVDLAGTPETQRVAVSDAAAPIVVAGAGMVVVEHGATAGTARPAGAAAVYWVGSVEPTNAEDHDLWYDTSA